MCPPEPNVVAIVVGVLAGILVIGIAILVGWKVLITIKDRREYFAFLKSVEAAKWETVGQCIRRIVWYWGTFTC